MRHLARNNRVSLAMIMAVILVTSACLSSNPKPVATTVPSALALKLKAPSIRGIITEVYQTSGILHAIFVEGKIESDTSYDRASVQVTDNTRIYLSTDRSYTLTSAMQLNVGVEVEVVFTGTILERDPVVAKADEILILGNTR